MMTGNRDAGYRRSAEGGEGGGIVDAERLGYRRDEAVARDHRGERHQKRRDLQEDDAERVDRPERRAGGEPDDQPGKDAEAALQPGHLQKVADGHGGDVHVGADRQVDAGGEKHERHADGDDADEGRLLDDAEHVLGAEEVGGAEAEIEKDHDEDDRRGVPQEKAGQPVAPRVRHAAAPCSRKAAARMASRSNSLRANSPTISPRLITRMRSQMASSSSSSEEMKSTPQASAVSRSMME